MPFQAWFIYTLEPGDLVYHFINPIWVGYCEVTQQDSKTSSFFLPRRVMTHPSYITPSLSLRDLTMFIRSFISFPPVPIPDGMLTEKKPILTWVWFHLKDPKYRLPNPGLNSCAPHALVVLHIGMRVHDRVWKTATSVRLSTTRW